MAELEDLKAQLAEQVTALESVDMLALQSPEDEEIVQMQSELRALVDELSHQIRLADTGNATTSCCSQIEIGTIYRFRHTDGRWHLGLVQSRHGNAVSVKFMQPTKQHMLTDVLVTEELLQPSSEPSTEKNFHPGSQVLALNSTSELWEEAEVENDEGTEVCLVYCNSGVKARMVRSSVVLLASLDYLNPVESSEDAGSMSTSEGSQESGSEVDEIDEQDEEQDTMRLANWESHTRGLGSKLMINMGYRVGASLGCRNSGIVAPLQVEMFRPGAGLGVEGGNLGVAKHNTNSKRRRGGRKARQKSQAKAAFLERQRKRDAELSTGDCGVFALVNQRLGNGSDSARRLQNQAERSSALLEPNKGGYFGNEKRNSGSNGGGQSRRDLVSGQEDIAALQAKIMRIKEMAGRNKKDANISKQAAHKLQAAEAELAALKARQSSSMSTLHAKEKEKKWLKF